MTAGEQEREPLSTERIVLAAIAIADASGLEAVSMRRIAGDLGSGTMSLYRHLPTREILIEQMVDEIAGRFSYPVPPPPDWRDALRIAAQTEWEKYIRHPWVLPATATSRPPLGPNVLTTMEWCMGALAGLGLTTSERFQMMVALEGFVQGTALSAVHGESSARSSGISTEARWEQQVPVLQERFASGAFPHLQQTLYEDDDKSPEATFRFGLERLLDGIDLYLAQRANQSP